MAVDYLDRSRKYIEGVLQTTDTLTPWQETYTWSRAVYENDILHGDFVGSWAGVFKYAPRSTRGTFQNTGISPSPILSQSNLGQPGMSDLDFVPYNVGTNTYGPKGPSLMGHPISFEVVGPTLKSTFCDWQWSVTYGTNTLTIAQGFHGTPILDLRPLYNITSTIPNGGYYVLVSFTGSSYPDSLASGTAIVPASQFAKYELFRVTSITATTIVLDTSKPLSTYFHGGDSIRGITLIQPKVTRLQALPTSGTVGKETVFVTLPPEHAALSEYLPPYNTGIAGSWFMGFFDDFNTTAGSNAYSTGALTPIPTPVPDEITQNSEQTPAVAVGNVPFPLAGVTNGSTLIATIASTPYTGTFNATAAAYTTSGESFASGVASTDTISLTLNGGSPFTVTWTGSENNATSFAATLSASFGSIAATASGASGHLVVTSTLLGSTSSVTINTAGTTTATKTALGLTGSGPWNGVNLGPNNVGNIAAVSEAEFATIMGTALGSNGYAGQAPLNGYPLVETSATGASASITMGGTLLSTLGFPASAQLGATLAEFVDPGSMYGRVTKTDGGVAFLSSLTADQMMLWVPKTAFPTASTVLTVGRILHIYGSDGAGDRTDMPGHPNAVFGWFEIKLVNTSDPFFVKVTVGRTPEVDPASGYITYSGGWQKAYGYTTPTAGDYLLSFTVHDPISSLYTSTTLRPDQLEASRLRRLIDPHQSGRSPVFQNPGASPYRPDRAIFNTRGNNTAGGNDDPGSLMDLGFRMVLFPSQVVSGALVPDYTRPISTREVVLDPAQALPQYIDIDYASGSVSFSCVPDPTNVGSAVYALGGLAGTNNPRGNLVLFAACVPATTENGQKGSGIRVTGGDVNAVSLGFSLTQTDAYGSRIILPGLTSWSVGTRKLVASIPSTGAPLLPYTGFFDLYKLDFSVEAGTFCYSGVAVNFGAGTITFSNVSRSSTELADPPAPITSYGLVIRKDPTVPFALDTTRGSSVKSSVIRMLGASFLTDMDGSVIVTPTSMSNYGLNDAYHLGALNTPGGGRVVSVNGGAVEGQTALTAGNTTDPLNAAFRANNLGDTANGGIGFDAVGNENGTFLSAAGFLDRVSWVFNSANTVLTASEPVTVATNQVTLTTGGHFFKNGSNTDLLLGLDMLVLSGGSSPSRVFIIASLASATVANVLDLNGAPPTLSGYTTASFYRVNFGSFHNSFAFNSTYMRGDATSPALQMAYSSLATGNTVAQVEVLQTDGSHIIPWYLNDLGTMVFSGVTSDADAGNASIEFKRSGVPTTLVDKSRDSSVAANTAEIGHMVRGTGHGLSHYDFTSMTPIILPGNSSVIQTFSFTATNNQIALTGVSGAWEQCFVPYGTLAHMTGNNMSVNDNGLFLVTGVYGSPTGLTLSLLDGVSNPNFPTSGTGTLVLYAASRMGSRLASIRNPNPIDGSGPTTFTPHTILSSGEENDATALALMGNGVAPKNAPFRVFTSTSMSAILSEIATIDGVGNFHSLGDFLYEGTGRSKTILIPIYSGRPSTGSGWNVPARTGTTDASWTTTTVTDWIYWDLVLPSSAALVSVTVAVNVGNVSTTGNGFHVYVDEISIVTTPSPSTITNLGYIEFLFAGPQKATITASASASRNNTMFRVAMRSTSTASTASDSVYYIQVTYTDYGPRNW